MLFGLRFLRIKIFFFFYLSNQLSKIWKVRDQSSNLLQNNLYQKFRYIYHNNLKNFFPVINYLFFLKTYLISNYKYRLFPWSSSSHCHTIKLRLLRIIFIWHPRQSHIETFFILSNSITCICSKQITNLINPFWKF